MQKQIFVAFVMMITAVGLAFHSFNERTAASWVAPAQAQVTQALPKLKPGEPLPHDLFVKLNRMINPAVVNIQTTYLPKQQRRTPPFNDPMFEFFQQFMGPMGPMQMRPAESLGTGFIIREDGLIVTNNHVIDKADVIKVQLVENAEKIYDAKVIGRDSKTDVALIKIESKTPLRVARLGSSSEVEVGEWVAAFGNPYGHGHTMTKGIISAMGRELDEINLAPFIQTDASINPGNSGGPLVNSQGLVIGVNTAIDQRAQGIGFAIPIDYVKRILPQLEKEGSVKRGFLGIQMAELNEEVAEYLGLKSTEGAFIVQVVPQSPAAKAGLKEYDVIVEMEGQKIKSWRDVQRLIANAPIGKPLAAKVIRNNKTTSLKVVVGEMPSEQALGGPAPQKSYEGQNAPFNFGFRVADYSAALAQEFGIPPLRQSGPIVIEVRPGSPARIAGLAPGDVILDVNKKRVAKAKDLLKALSSDKNVLRVLKRDRVVLLQLPASR